MPKHIFNYRYFFFYLVITLTIMTNIGCQSLRKNEIKAKELPIESGRIVVLGFLPAIGQSDEEAGIVQSPISGASFMAEPVKQTTADDLSEVLFQRMMDSRKYDLISADQAKGILSNTTSRYHGMRDLDIYQKTGQAFSADAVMVGYIYRWQEREGTDYSARRPASVAFELYLIRSSDKAILWKGRFDETQKALSENIFNMGVFLKNKGKWITADDMAILGLEELLAIPDQENP